LAKMKMTTCKRRDQRYQNNGHLKSSFTSNGLVTQFLPTKQYDAVLTNLSINGAGIMTDSMLLKEGDNIILTISSPRNANVVVNAQVMYSQTINDNDHRAGLLFNGHDTADIQSLITIYLL